MVFAPPVASSAGRYRATVGPCLPTLPSVPEALVLVVGA